MLAGLGSQLTYIHIYRSSHRRCSVRKDVLRNFAKFTGKHLCQGLFFNKVVGYFTLIWNLLSHFNEKVCYPEKRLF